jgi:spore germination cell wall hydrolase CwlJ-like protein
MRLGLSQKRAMMTAPLLLAVASCVPAQAVQKVAAPAANAAPQGPAIATSQGPAIALREIPEWAKLEPGMPYRLLEKAVAAPRAFDGEAKSEDDQLRSVECLTQAIYYEAASESEDGQRAVAQVVLNRVHHAAYPNNVCGVVYQGSHLRTGCQFTFTCDGSLARRPTAFAWARARRIAAEALAGEVYGPVGTATHYHTTAILPYWASSLTRAAVVGAHVFYHMRGSQGRAGAFNQRYAGFEPGATAVADALVTEASPPVVLAARPDVEVGVRKWKGATPEVRIHRGSAAKVETAAASPDEAPRRLKQVSR